MDFQSKERTLSNTSANSEDENEGAKAPRRTFEINTEFHQN